MEYTPKLQNVHFDVKNNDDPLGLEVASVPTNPCSDAVNPWLGHFMKRPHIVLDQRQWGLYGGVPQNAG